MDNLNDPNAGIWGIILGVILIIGYFRSKNLRVFINKSFLAPFKSFFDKQKSWSDRFFDLFVFYFIFSLIAGTIYAIYAITNEILK
jgi:multisubunit Na+/H+ antiporter MnhB subunit